MWSILIPSSSEGQDALVTELWEQGTSGIIEEPAGLRAFFEDAISPHQLPFTKGEFRQETAAPQAFRQEDWEPILIGQRFLLAPPWLDVPVPERRVRITIDAATAFGTGRHETTQLCLEALETYLQPGAQVVDVGCGSGIISAAAALLDAGSVLACDIHQDAIEVARRHSRAHVFLGSADALASSVADLVFANISARILDHIAADLKRILKPSGVLVLSGFIAERPPKYFRPMDQTVQGDWLCWVCRAEDISPDHQNADPNLHSPDWWL